MLKKKRRQSKYFAPQNENSSHKCDHPGCNKAGEYRAPKDKNLKEYYWFCLEHVQEYNSKWNYFGDDLFQTDEEENAKKNSFSSDFKYGFGLNYDDIYKFFSSQTHYYKATKKRFTKDERKALEIMELSEETVSVDELKKAYKKAAKKYHPDLNKDDKGAENKFKLISTTYKSILQKIS